MVRISFMSVYSLKAWSEADAPLMNHRVTCVCTQEIEMEYWQWSYHSSCWQSLSRFSLGILCLFAIIFQLHYMKTAIWTAIILLTLTIRLWRELLQHLVMRKIRWCFSTLHCLRVTSQMWEMETVQIVTGQSNVPILSSGFSPSLDNGWAIFDEVLSPQLWCVVYRIHQL